MSNRPTTKPSPSYGENSFSSVMSRHANMIHALKRPSVADCLPLLRECYDIQDWEEVESEREDDEKHGTRTFRPAVKTDKVNWTTWGYSHFTGELTCFMD